MRGQSNKRRKNHQPGRTKRPKTELFIRQSARLGRRRADQSVTADEPSPCGSRWVATRFVEASSGSESHEPEVSQCPDDALACVTETTDFEDDHCPISMGIVIDAEDACQQSSSATKLTSEGQVDLRSLADQVRAGISIDTKIKVPEAVYATSRGTRKRDYDTLSSVDCLVVSDMTGCLSLPDQLDMHATISKAEDIQMASGATSDLLKRGIVIAQKLRFTRAIYSATGNVVCAGAPGSTLCDQFTSAYTVIVLGGCRRQEIRHRRIVAATHSQSVFLHTMFQDPALNRTCQIALPTAKNSKESLGEAAKSFGHSKKGREAWSDGLQHALGSVDEPDLTYLFMFGMCTALDIKAAMCYPHMAAPTLRMADTTGKLRDLYPSQAFGPGGAGQGPLLERINAACAEGRTHIPMLCEGAIYAFVVWEVLRDEPASEIVDPPLQVHTSDVYVRRTQEIRWHGCQFWTSWPASVKGRAGLDPKLAKAREAVCDNPHLIITGMAEIAKMLGLTVQLDEAIARMINILSGPLEPLQPNLGPVTGQVPPFYVAMTAFGEMGTLHAPAVYGVPMAYSFSELSTCTIHDPVLEKLADEATIGGGEGKSVSGRASKDSGQEDSKAGAPKKVVPKKINLTDASADDSIAYVASLMSSSVNTSVDILAVLSALGASTNAAVCGVKSASGIQWQHEREVYGASPRVSSYVLRNQMYSRQPGPNGSGANLIVRATVLVCNELFGYLWPSASLPSMQLSSEYELPPALVDRLGVLGRTFGGCDKLRTFLPLFKEIPDIYPLSRAGATGSLKGTIQFEEETAHVFEFRARHLRTTTEWVSMIKDNSSNMDTLVVQEINLLVSVGLWAMRHLFCKIAYIARENLPLSATNMVAISAARAKLSRRVPTWWATHSKFLNGSAWVEALTYEVLKLTTMRTSLEVGLADVGDIPGQELVWDEYHCCLDLDSVHFQELRDGVVHYYVPRLDLTDFPVEIRTVLSQWAGGSSTEAEVVMRPVEWYTMQIDENTSDRPPAALDTRRYKTKNTGKESFDEE